MPQPTVEVHLSAADLDRALREDARAGLTADPKWLPPKWFYDARGSELFDKITELPEYYPTRTERSLLQSVAPEVARLTRPRTLVELGSGSAIKTQLLLRACNASGTLVSYVPQDVSASALRKAAIEISAAFPGLAVNGVVSDFTDTLHYLPGGGSRMIAFLGGTLGNLIPDERAAFLGQVRAALDEGEHLLLGVALVTDPTVMVAAYDDRAGVTAEFNRNVLHVLNHQLGADFAPERFRHVAVWNDADEWIEMRLEATEEMSVKLRELDLTVGFADGEQLRTEISAKFRIAGIEQELAAAGFAPDHVWTDSFDRFALVLASAV
ncbi:L-histidine N(alpha)-methyltransferase [Skermania piniformis]|uniref:Histidine N-alpha-methyltransferase n=1 Tax=Skermania pinensis TaxID=39122 RepID=A0ABX8S743_9ACTN|nr:L-histidine N(alpha)-methyltransferase [Skermania piniformis]QXQ13086.1 L-histidine N(alpha)-methyltransferase [Skermania piniformis]